VSTKILPAIQMIGFGLLAATIKLVLPMADFSFMARDLLVLLFILLALTLLLASGALFRYHRTTVNPVHPHKASALVISGLYRYTRNPMYLGFLSLLFAWVLYLGNAAAFLVLPIFVFSLNRLNIIPEEQALQARFGEAYSAYQKQVRRWL